MLLMTVERRMRVYAVGVLLCGESVMEKVKIGILAWVKICDVWLRKV